MTDTTIGGAVAHALDEGVASVSDGAENIDSAGFINALATHVQGSYVRDGSLGFNDVDTNGNEVDVDPGRCFVAVADVDIQSDRSGAVTPSYDTTLGADVVLAVDVPTEVTNLGLDAGTNDVWVAVDADGSTTGAAGDVYVRHGSGLSAPSDPSVKLGSVDASSGATTRANDRPSPSLADASFPDLGGAPAFSNHGHSEGGLSTVPNSGLANSVVTVAGNQVGLGGSTGVDLADLAGKPHSALDDAPAGAHHVAHEHPGDQPATGDITDGKANTIYSYSDEWVPREQVDDERTTTTAVTTDTTTSGEEVLLVDTSGGAVTITLASADLSTGNVVTVVDMGGSAEQNPITVDTEGSENIDGDASIAVDTDYGATVVVADSNSGQWYTAGGGSGEAVTIQDDGTLVADPVETLDAQAGLDADLFSAGVVELAVEHQEVFAGRESGTVSDTNQGTLVIDHLADGETVEVYKAALTLADGQAAPSGLDLELVTLDNAGSFTSRARLVSGDGSTVFDDETGAPLGSYTNSSGGGQTIGVLVDNATGNPQDVMAAAEGVTDA
jgi:hypothetical protein